MKYYFVQGYGLWMIVKALNERKARSAGVEEYGRGKTALVRIATTDEVEDFIRQKGESAISVVE